MELTGDEMRIIFRALRADSILCQHHIFDAKGPGAGSLAECYRDRITENDALMDILRKRADTHE